MNSLSGPDATEILDLNPAATLVLDRTGRVLYSSPASHAVIRADGILFTRDGVLTARRKSEHRALHAALADLTGVGATICLRSREGVPIVVIDLHLLHSGRLAARIIDVTLRPTPSAARLRRVLGLTPAETRVAAALVAGLSITAAAQAHGVEAETVRTQVKRIRSKAGARSQNQLLGTLAALGSGFDPPVN